MRRMIIGLATTALILGGAVGTAQAAGLLTATPTSIAGATLDVTVPTAASPVGVSPEVFYDEATKTYYLYTTAMPAKTYRSTDGVNWTEVADARLPNGFDWSIVQMGPNDYRLYYSEINPNAPATVQCSKQRKQLRYATSSDLLHWTAQPGVLMDDVGCGVPHVLRKPDGSYLLYFNTITTQHGVHIATSPDGLTWTMRPGLVADDPQFVDPAPLRMPDGTYLMVGSTTGGPGKGQELRILSSPDGLTWTERAKSLYAPAGASALDPSLKLIDGNLRMWFGYAPGFDHMNSKIASGNLTLANGTPSSGSAMAAAGGPTGMQPGAPCKKAGQKKVIAGKGTLTCTKKGAKLVWVGKPARR